MFLASRDRRISFILRVEQRLAFAATNNLHVSVYRSESSVVPLLLMRDLFVMAVSFLLNTA